MLLPPVFRVGSAADRYRGVSTSIKVHHFMRQDVNFHLVCLGLLFYQLILTKEFSILILCMILPIGHTLYILHITLLYFLES